jgi:hypothetical protein
MAGISETLDALWQVKVNREGDARTTTVVLSDKTLTEHMRQRVYVPAGGTTTATPYTMEVSLGGIGTNTATKLVFIESDKRVKAQWCTRNGTATKDLTTLTAEGNNIPAGGYFMAMLTALTHVWISNKATGITTVDVAVYIYS